MVDKAGPENIGGGRDPSLTQVLGNQSPVHVRLLSAIPGSVQYYEYASGDPDDMRSLVGKIRAETPPLGALREVFSDHIVDLSENLRWPVTSPEAPKVVQSEFDIALLTFFMCSELKEPLRALDSPSDLTRGFDETVATLDVNDLDKMMPELSNRSVALWTLSAGLAQNSLRRITGEADRPWNPGVVASFPEDQQMEYYRRRYAQQVCILTIARSLEMLD